MSVLITGLNRIIKGMEMPKLEKTYKVRLYKAVDGRIIVTACGIKDNLLRPVGEVIEIPTPHGRLIDADAHIIEIRKQYCEDCSRRKGVKNGKIKFLYEIGGVVCRACEIEDMLNALDDALTVIEAEGET